MTLPSLSHGVPKPTRMQIILWLAILGVSSLLYLIHFNTFQIGVFGDDSSYVVLARSLLHSPTYGLINFPGEPLPSKYPFGYPVFLALMEGLAPGRLDFFPVFSLLASLVNISLLFWGWKWIFPAKSYYWGLTVAALYGLAPDTVGQSSQVMAEPIFTTFCLTTIILAEFFIRTETVRQSWSTWMALSLVMMAYIRTVGLFMGILILGYLLIRRGRQGWRALAWMGAKAVIVLGLILLLTSVQARDLLPLEYLNDENAEILNMLSPSSTSSAVGEEPAPDSSGPTQAPANPSQPGLLSGLAAKLQYGIRQHLGSDVRDLIIPIGGGDRENAFFESRGLAFVPDLFGYLVSAFAFFGILLAGRRCGFTVFLVFALLYFPLLFLWNWVGTRLLYPIQAQLYLGMLFAFDAILQKIPIPGRNLITARGLALGLFAAGLLSIYVWRSSRIPSSYDFVGDLSRRSAWLEANAAPEDVVMTEYPETDYVYSGMRTIDYPVVEDVQSFWDYLSGHHAQWILVAPRIYWDASLQPDLSSEAEALLPYLQSLERQEFIDTVYRSEESGIRVYQVRPEQVGQRMIQVEEVEP